MFPRSIRSPAKDSRESMGRRSSTRECRGGLDLERESAERRLAATRGHRVAESDDVELATEQEGRGEVHRNREIALEWKVCSERSREAGDVGIDGDERLPEPR